MIKRRFLSRNSGAFYADPTDEYCKQLLVFYVSVKRKRSISVYSDMLQTMSFFIYPRDTLQYLRLVYRAEKDIRGVGLH